MGSRQRKLEVFNGVIKIPANKIRYHSHKIKHVGKSNHILSGTFSVLQGQENVVSKVRFYIFSEKQFLNWFFNNLGFTGYSFFNEKSNFVYYKEVSQGKFNLPVKGDASVYFALDNRYFLTVNKQVQLNIIEEWDEDFREPDIVTTVPPQDESLKTEIERMVDESKQSLKIISPYVDMTLLNSLIERQNHGVNVQIILRKDKEVKGLAKDGLNQIRRNFPRNYRLHEEVHSRVIIRDDTNVLISSADLTQKSLQGQLNLGILISDPKIVDKVVDFFNKVWQESKSK